ncbi:MAG: glycoside hydrolase family 5 protein, partial [Allobaculum sp.]|nr:glycoside hydrolase family 5 protein [Allobaculum sp.]
MPIFSSMKHFLKQSLAGFMSVAFLLPTSIPILAAEVGEVEMHRLYNQATGEHFYTANLEERDTLRAGGWKYEGIGWVAPETGDPVYRVYNPGNQDHHYTPSENEKDTLVRLGWSYEGIGWYSDPAQHMAVYREYNPNAKTGNHNYTTSLAEHQALVKLGWNNEDIAWYALKEGVTAPATSSSELSPLHVQGTQLMNAQNQPIVLQGYSTFGLNYMPEFVDQSVFEFLRDQMGSKIVRLALYTQEYGGYCSGGNKEQFKALIDKGVSLAEQTNQYIIIDWHILSDGNPNIHADEAEAFFREMATKYANKSHVIYEICNEPNGCSWSEIKRYAHRIIPVIRAADPDAVILVGTPTWSQDVDT